MQRSNAIARPSDSSAGTPYTRRASFLPRDNYYVGAQDEIPAHVFMAERTQALDPAGPTGFIVLDYRERIGSDYPATTPLILARYAKIRAGENLASRFKASGEIYYVIRGSGQTCSGADTIHWKMGDVFCFPGGEESVHRAGNEDCLLWVLTNEPLLSFENVEPPRPGAGPILPVHYLAEEIHLNLVHTQEVEARKGAASNGNGAFIFSSESFMEKRRLPFPTLMLALNSLVPGNDQRPHLHNAVALTLVLESENCYSMINGKRYDWLDLAAVITPPGQVHSHHNKGSKLTRFLIAQDSGMHYYCRTSGFSYA